MFPEVASESQLSAVLEAI